MPFINIKVSPIALSIYLASLTTLCYNINSLNLTRTYEIFKERFNDASNQMKSKKLEDYTIFFIAKSLWLVCENTSTTT